MRHPTGGSNLAGEHSGRAADTHRSDLISLQWSDWSRGTQRL